MTQDAKVRLRLDTKMAKSELRDLNREAAGTSRRMRSMGGGGRAGLGGFLGGLGGAVLGGAMGAVRSSAAGPSSDLFGTLTDPMRVLWQKLGKGTGNLDLEQASADAARATMPFRAAGAAGKIPEGSEQLFKARQRIFMENMQGRRLFDADSRFGGPLSKKAGEAAERVEKKIEDGFDMLRRLFGGGGNPR